MKTNADQVNYKIVPEVLQTHAGEVEVTIQGTFPEKYFDKNTVLQATPILTYQGGETAFESVKVQGEKVQDNFKVISYAGGNFSYKGKVPFKEEMMVSDLVLRVTATRKGTSLDFDTKKLADGVIATSTLVDADPHPIVMKDNFQRVVPEEMMANIQYLINMANIRSSELKSEDIAALKEYMELVKDNERMEFTGTSISAYASPDGELSFNDKLAEKRAETALEYIKREFEKSKIEDVNKGSFLQSRSTAEDWEGFRTEVSNSNMADKDLILRVLSMYSDPVVREREIRNISAAFEVLKTDILPKLRRSKITITTNKIGKTDNEILQAIRTDASVLGLEELLYAATLTDNLNEQLNFYKITADKFPKCARAHNNVGLIEMHLGNIDKAESAFKKAQAIQNNDIVKNNLGYVALVQGDIAEAAELFNSVAAPTMESKHGLGTIAIMNGEYDRAVNLFGNDPSVNHALALILKGDNNRAKSMLDGMQMPDNGTGSYLKAVVGARMDNADYMINGLREAIGFNSDWAAYAAKDIEFAKFANNSTFEGLIRR